MITFLTLCYCGLIWLLAFKLKWLPWNRKTQIGAVTIGLVAIGALVIAMNLYQPYTTQATVVEHVTPIIARVQGRLIELPIEPHVPLKEGDVLFRIDPQPYQAKVDELRAALAESQQDVPQLKAALDQAIAAVERSRVEVEVAKIQYDKQEELLARDAGSEFERDLMRLKYEQSQAVLREAEAARDKARLAYESQIDGQNTTVAQIQAQLDRAMVDLNECTVYAPADGYVTQLFVQPGAVTLLTPFSSVMSFVYAGDSKIAATFKTNSLRYLKPGDPVEIALDTQPGRIYTGSLVTVIQATGEGALTPGGDLMISTSWVSQGPVVARIQCDENLTELGVPVGTGAAVAIYTEHGKPIRIIRRVIIRIKSWLDYL